MKLKTFVLDTEKQQFLRLQSYAYFPGSKSPWKQLLLSRQAQDCVLTHSPFLSFTATIIGLMSKYKTDSVFNWGIIKFPIDGIIVKTEKNANQGVRAQRKTLLNMKLGQQLLIGLHFYFESTRKLGQCDVPLMHCQDQSLKRETEGRMSVVGLEMKINLFNLWPKHPMFVLF